VRPSPEFTINRSVITADPSLCTDVSGACNEVFRSFGDAYKSRGTLSLSYTIDAIQSVVQGSANRWRIPTYRVENDKYLTARVLNTGHGSGR
jgi:hypothetical protein